VTASAPPALLAGLIDHAALFPPASMSMAAAVAEDRWARSTAEGWLLDRFIVPAARLDELRDAAGGWAGLPPLSVIWDGRGDPPPAVAPVVLAEVPPGGDVAAVRALGVPVFAEGRAEDVDRIAASGATGAKLRCGGDAGVPADAELAGFVAACRDAGLPFKATAGLHHPVRHDGGHGFLNLLAAAAAARRGADAATLAGVLAERDPDALLAAQDPAARELFTAYGSCSFREPVADLRALGVL